MKASSMLKIMILGATSAIAHETARNFARDGAQFFLVARNTDKLNAISSDLQAFGAGQVACATVDLNDTSAHAGLIDSALGALGGLDAVILCYGTLPDQSAVEKEYDAALQEFQTNFLSSMSFLTVAGNFFEKQRRGVITVVSSVAGDRGRASNYVYGSAMAAKTAFRKRIAQPPCQEWCTSCDSKTGAGRYADDSRYEEGADLGRRINRRAGHLHSHETGARCGLHPLVLAVYYDHYPADPGADFQAPEPVVVLIEPLL
jgi:NADP-dependent 3-hydroxy acid dehydrogenase YdfG